MRNNALARAVCCILCLMLFAGCASTKNTPPASQSQDGATLPPSDEAVRPHPGSVAEVLDDYDTGPQQAIADPLEPWNRFWFHFNDIFYLYIARPLYRGYDFVMPDEFQSGLKNFLSNLLFPVRFVNALLQGRVQAAGVEFGRFIVNSTVGFGGFIDAAKGRKTVVSVDPIGEDLGQTLGYWGMGEGFYLVWPIIGPSSARDSVGLAGDAFLNPSFYLSSWQLSAAINGTLRFNSLGDILPTYEDVKGAAVDPYVGMREAYATFRQLHIQR